MLILLSNNNNNNNNIYINRLNNYNIYLLNKNSTVSNNTTPLQPKVIFKISSKNRIKL